MCGVAGIARSEPRDIDAGILLRMAGALRHRGPDGFGIYTGGGVGLAHTRLSIIDLRSGAQPLTNEDGQVVVVFNGEIFNFLELRTVLESKGHRFRTQTDTEVLVHGYEEWGEGLIPKLNGEFAFALHDRRRGEILLARDRFGIRPLFYARRDGDLLFASEAKAIFASGEVSAEPDYAGIDEVFTCWASRPPRTVFRGIEALEPGAFGRWKDGRLRITRYYEFAFREPETEPSDAVGRLDEILRDSVRLRLQADVPVGGYLSGGLDSSCTCSLAAEASPYAVRTFSVTFDDPALNEAEFQRLVAKRIRSEHAVQAISTHDIRDVFPEVVWHAETPMVRTGPAPLYLLSKLTRDRGIKVVLSGEGADELFLGYDLFKETVVRLFCLRQPESRVRPRLFDRLYPYLEQKRRGGEFWRKFFLQAGSPSDPLFSHLPRFLLTARIKDFYSPAMREAVAGEDALDALRHSLPEAFRTWSPLHRAAYLEMVTLLSPYLLSTQGDRMAMAHGVEGRVPFLDHRLFEFVASLPTKSKLRGLREKDLLRRWASRHVPAEVLARPKQPYRAPDVPAFFDGGVADYVEDALGSDGVAQTGFFDATAVAGLVRRCREGRATGFRENQAFVGILSAQLWHRQFVAQPRQLPRLHLEDADVALGDEVTVTS